MATDMGRGIMAPDSSENISSTGVEEMRTLAASTAAAIGSARSESMDEIAAARWTRGRAPMGTDWNTVFTPGLYYISSTSFAQSMFNLPEVSPGIMVVESDPSVSTSIAFQTFRPSRSTRVWERATQGSEGWSTAWVLKEDAGAADDYALANSVLQDFFSHEMGGTIDTGGKGAVAIRIDHGLKNFDEMYRPLFEARGIPYALAISSRRWDHPENEGITPAIVNSWVEGGLCEIWNHGALAHNSVNGFDDIYDYWVTGREELEDQIPAAKVWGAAPPGTGDGEAFDGMGSATTAERIYGTTGGKLILGSHAVLTGTGAGREEWVLDGTIRQGNGRLSCDSLSAAQIISRIDSAANRRRGLQFFWHPSVVGGSGDNGVEKWTQVLDHIAAERDAGRLAALSPYQMLLADSTR